MNEPAANTTNNCTQAMEGMQMAIKLMHYLSF